MMVGAGLRRDAGSPHICTTPRSSRAHRSESSFGGACSMNSSGTSAVRAAQPITERHASAAAGVTEYMRAFASISVGLDTGLAHHVAPALVLRLDARRELGRRFARGL